MNKHTALLALTIVSGYAFGADSAPVSSVPTTETGYQTEQEAVKAGLSQAALASDSVEYAGAVVKAADGLFYYTTPVSTGKAGSFAVRLVFGKTDKLVAIFHTHPGADTAQSSKFSKDDKRIQSALGVPSYIEALSTRTVYKLSGGWASQV